MANNKSTKPRRGVSVKRLGNDLKAPGTILLGMVGTQMIDKFLLSKVGFLNKTDNFSKFIKPAVIVGIGLVGRQMVANQTVKTALDGMTIYGALKTVNAATGKDVLTDGLAGLAPYREPRRVPAPLPEFYDSKSPLNGNRSRSI